MIEERGICRARKVVANRIGLAKGTTRHWLILHGRYVCKARNPLCAECCIVDLCEYPDKT